MKKNRKKILGTLLCIFVLAFTMTSCGGDPSEDGSDIKTIIVSFSILYPENSGKANVENHKMQVQEDATILQLLESYTDQEGLESEINNSGTPYITSINEVRENGSFGWVCEVNGSSRLTKGVSNYKVQNGDRIVWKFVEL